LFRSQELGFFLTPYRFHACPNCAPHLLSDRQSIALANLAQRLEELGVNSKIGAELHAKATIAAALIASHAVEIPMIPKVRHGAMDSAAIRLRDLTEYV
jgi:hypothetical protein